MKVLANENFPRLTVEALRQQGHDVLWARTDMPGMPDHEVLRRAQKDERVVITFDKHLGELAFRWGLPALCGVILVRLELRSPEGARQQTLDVLSSRSDWRGHFAVVEEHRIRIRPLPSAP